MELNADQITLFKPLGMVQMNLTVSCHAIVIQAASDAVNNCFGVVPTVKFD